MTSTSPIKHDIFPLTQAQLGALVSPLNPARVASRSQGRSNLSYLEAWDVKRTLIRCFGFGGFSAELIDAECVFREQVPQARDASKTNWKVAYRCTVRLTIHQLGAVYTESAIADSSQPDFTESADMALKSAESDALKRAAIYLGTQFGLSLYDNGSTNDIVNRVLAPEQVWPPQAPAQPAGPQQGQRQIEDANAARQAQVHPGAVEAARQMYPQPAEGVTPEQYEANLQLLGAAMQSKASRDGDQRPLNDDEILTVLNGGQLQPQQ